MSYTLVPHGAGKTSATLWMGAGPEPPAGELELAVGSERFERVPSDWRAFAVGGREAYWTQRVELSGLSPAARHHVGLYADGAGTELARATVKTLPERLPSRGQQPFICLLGSCFSRLADRGGAAGAAVVGLPAALSPDVKFLCGDQVYLDTPPGRFTITYFGEADLRQILLEHYVRSFDQRAAASGFARLLAEGASYFMSDDHEFWNNAPNKTALVRNTYWWPFGDEGQSWMRAARELYELFQARSPSAQIDVAPLSIRVLDTRIARTGDRQYFCDPEQMRAIADWISALRGPGVLVVGQPIFQAHAGLAGNIFDWGLPDFAQYAELVRAVQVSQHDLLVLTGDVHFGRVATCRLPSGAEVVEVIASPLALVSPFAGSRWKPPPHRFPEAAVTGAVGLRTAFDAGHQLTANHFATLEFSADGGRVWVTIKAWPIPEAGVRPKARTILERGLA